MAAVIQEQVGKMLLTDMKDPHVHLITVTKVEVTDDLRYAKIYYSVLGDEEKKKLAEKALERSRGYVRTGVGRRLALRFAPEIRFVYDDTSAYADHIEQLLKKIKDE